MALRAGSHLGPYQILSLLGAGGMGEVYRARDPKLNRDVAIKVLPDAFARDPQRLARFEREAQVLASLNHPNIAAIYELGQSGDLRYLVLEYVPGENLAGPLPVEDALRVCRQIAEALEAAHAKGVMHRDLKPANVKITPEDQVKVLDFGLAKAFSEESPEGDPAQSPTLSVAPTKHGMILGTASYMSPEQARGRKLDKRTDIWSFGCVLYEALSGRQAFSGDSTLDTLSAVAGRDPDWGALPAATPANIRVLLRRCLQRDLARRLHDIADARLELEQPAAPLESAAAPRQPSKRLALPWVVAALMTALAAFLGWRQLSGPQVARQQPVHLAMSLPESITVSSGPRSTLAISPDGTQVVFVGSSKGGTQLYRRELRRTDVEPIPGTERAVTPLFSLDGQWIGFFQDGMLKKVPLRGGPPVTLCDAPAPFGASWGPDDNIVFSGSFGTGLSRVPAAGGKPETLTTLNRGDVAHRFPFVLPGGGGVLYIQFSSGAPEIWASSLRTAERRKLTQGTFPLYSPTGHLVFARGGTLMAAPMDPAGLRLIGPPLPLPESVATDILGTGYFHFSANGTLVYLRGAGFAQHTLEWATRQGASRALPYPKRAYDQPGLSPDGKKVAVVDRGPKDVWVFDLEREASTRLTLTRTKTRRPCGRPTAGESPSRIPPRPARAFCGNRPTAAQRRKPCWPPTTTSTSARGLRTASCWPIRSSIRRPTGISGCFRWQAKPARPSANRAPFSTPRPTNSWAAFPRMAAGWLTFPMRPAPLKSTFGPRRIPPGEGGRSRPTAATSPCGRAVAASCFIATKGS